MRQVGGLFILQAPRNFALLDFCNLNLGSNFPNFFSDYYKVVYSEHEVNLLPQRIHFSIVVFSKRGGKREEGISSLTSSSINIVTVF